MSAFVLTKTRFRKGVWEGIVTATGTRTGSTAGQPEIIVSHLEKQVSGVEMTEDRDAARWFLRIPVPSEVIGDGVQTFLICDASDGTVLDSFALISGEALGDDIRAETELLRAELDMLKRAFRRHCLETT